MKSIGTITHRKLGGGHFSLCNQMQSINSHVSASGNGCAAFPQRNLSWSSEELACGGGRARARLCRNTAVLKNGIIMIQQGKSAKWQKTLSVNSRALILSKNSGVSLAKIQKMGSNWLRIGKHWQPLAKHPLRIG